jgi:Domain of unknown function (DUF5710)
MRQWLDVPFTDKDLARRCGARWDPAVKRWYAPRPGMRGLERWAARPDLPLLLPGEDRTFGEGLFVDLVPATAWWTHARYCIAPQDWDRVRRMVTTRARRRCEACGRGEDPARGLRLEAHERWEYDARDRKQILRRLVCFCTGCHSVTHYGLAEVRGESGQAFEHLRIIAGMSPAQAEMHVREAFDLWDYRSGITWDLDLGILTAAGIAIVQPAGTGDERARKAGAEDQRSHALTAGPKSQTGSRWERWLQTGER